MKDSKQIRKMLFVSKSNVALIVMKNVENENNILFADQVNMNIDNLQAKTSELLTNAANFLGFNIKNVQMIFDDNQVTNWQMTNQEFAACSDEHDITKEIFKIAKINNKFVNEINFLGVVYDDATQSATINANICASDYITYKRFINEVKKCNIKITSSHNIYTLLKQNKEQIELVLNINDNVVAACHYYGGKLSKVNAIDLDWSRIENAISQTLEIKPNRINEALKVANELLINNNLDITISNNYDLKSKAFKNIKLGDLLRVYRNEIKQQINNKIDFSHFQNVSVIANNQINQIPDFDFVASDLGFTNLPIEKLICLANINLDKDMNQFAFESKLQAMELGA